jgi:hypothetical protein
MREAHVTQCRYFLQQILFNFVFHDGTRITEALQFYRGYCVGAPAEVSSFAICGEVPAEERFPQAIHGKPYVLFASCYAGDVEDGRRIMQPLRDFAEPLANFSAPMSYREEVQTMLDEDYPEGLRYYWKSLYLEDLSNDAIDCLVEHNEKRRQPSRPSTSRIWPARCVTSVQTQRLLPVAALPSC